MTQQIGVVGLAVMGKNLAWNIESRGYSVSVFNRSRQKTDEMVEESKGKNIHPTYSLEEFVKSLEKPRKI
ncbi:NAD(P)-binding domain-containing protein, partial [Staphylococcus sp. HMSC078A08]